MGTKIVAVVVGMTFASVVACEERVVQPVVVALNPAGAAGMPSTTMLPLVGARIAQSSFASVLLPLPLWPMIATSSPGAMCRLTSLRAGIASSRPAL